MRKFLIIVPIILIITGCVNYTELNNLEIVEKMAIDYNENTYKVTISTIEKQDKKIRKTYEVNARGINDAIKNLNIIADKKIYIAHMDILLITENAYNLKIDEIMNYFLNEKSSRNDFLIALVNDTSIIKEDIDLYEKIKIIEKNFATIKSINMESMLKDILDNKITYIPNISYDNDIKIEGISLINDKKIFTKLDREDTVIFNYVHDNIKNTDIDNINVVSNNTSLSYKKNTIKLDINSTLYQDNDSYNNLIKNKINNLFTKYKEQNYDIFNFEDICKKNIKEINIKVNVDHTSNSNIMEVKND